MAEDIKFIKIREKDYRAALAFLWSILTFLLLFYAIKVGWDTQEVLSLAGSLFALDIIFIKAYFDAKEAHA